MKIEFEATGGICPYCKNEAREGVPYKSKHAYIKHVNDCRARPKDPKPDKIKKTKKKDIGIPKPPPDQPTKADVKKEYTVLVKRDGAGGDCDKWDTKYHGGNKIMADRTETEWRAQGKTVKVEVK